MKAEFTVRILGRDVTIRSDANEDHVRAVEALVAERLSALTGAGLAHQHALTVALLGLADELIREQTAHQTLRDKIRARSSALLERLSLKKVA